MFPKVTFYIFRFLNLFRGLIGGPHLNFYKVWLEVAKTVVRVFCIVICAVYRDVGVRLLVNLEIGSLIEIVGNNRDEKTYLTTSLMSRPQSPTPSKIVGRNV